jgi:hypothetical protein
MSEQLVDYLEHIAKIGMFPEITESNITKMEMCAANFWASKNHRFEANTARLRNSK